ncbi:ESX secretion-associated protein EspG [Nocardia sp. NBC_00881]|uniref:ESX secretion-associated protein EspG n=1 Tax=Nocardia sp. NBC_00881 TaxID=2975995 RepID=UPI0038630295|nr:ESX secretion-associated protein EspG [Nocardia sp. NBC_00881]
MTDLELVVLWERMKEDGVLPRPFVFTSSTLLHRDYEREKMQTEDRLRDEVVPTLGGILEVVARPDIRVVVYGWDPRNPKDPESYIRLLAVRRADRAFLLTQKPGETIWHSGGFTIVEHHVLALSDAVVSALHQPCAGSRGEVVLTTMGDRTAELDDTYYRPVHRAADDTPQQRSAEFRSSAADSVGVIEISQGASVFGPRGITRHVLRWRDIVGDGRYAITPGPPPVAIPAGNRRMTELLNSRLADVVRTIKDEPTR